MSDALQDVTQARRRVERLVARLDEARAERDAAMTEAIRAGHSTQETADAAGVTRAYVSRVTIPVLGSRGRFGRG